MKNNFRHIISYPVVALESAPITTPPSNSQAMIDV